jgi:hypothetical protein
MYLTLKCTTSKTPPKDETRDRPEYCLQFNQSAEARNEIENIVDSLIPQNLCTSLLPKCKGVNATRDVEASATTTADPEHVCPKDSMCIEHDITTHTYNCSIHMHDMYSMSRLSRLCCSIKTE